jgi:FkbM family methyltransferase
MATFLPYLKQSGHLDQVHMTICNVGSRKVNMSHDYASRGWQIFEPNLTIYGFDADADACDAANADLNARQITWQEQHFPIALSGSVGERTLHVTTDPQCSSLYAPNASLLKRFNNLQQVALEFTVEVETMTLDAFFQEENLRAVDFLQVDVQGAELEVLSGATQILSNVLAIDIEVEFAPLYLNQPLFADVDSFLRQKDFSIADLRLSRHVRARSPICSTQRPGQVLWGEAVYFLDLLQPTAPERHKTPSQIFKLACIADVLHFSDYTLELLEYLTVNYGNDPAYNFADTIFLALKDLLELSEQDIIALPIMINLKRYLTSKSREISFSESKTSILSTPKTISSLPPSPLEAFRHVRYIQHNQRRLEHLASLGLDLENKTVLEVGAGIGDHTQFFLDRGCQVTVTEGRPENLEILKKRYPSLPVLYLDMDSPDENFDQKFDIVYCYGLLYHLKNPAEAIAFMAQRCQRILLMETGVSYGEDEVIKVHEEPANHPTHGVSGFGCFPTRSWIYHRLRQNFEFVYLPITQPYHEEFPIDWTAPVHTSTGIVRAIFIASHYPIENPLLVKTIPMQQRRI